MFDHEKLTVYQKAKKFNIEVIDLLDGNQFDKHLSSQLRRASLSIMLNIAEGTSRFSKADRKRFYIIARGSTYECAAMFDFLKGRYSSISKTYQQFYSILEEISKMLFVMIRNLEKNMK